MALTFFLDCLKTYIPVGFGIYFSLSRNIKNKQNIDKLLKFFVLRIVFSMMEYLAVQIVKFNQTIVEVIMLILFFFLTIYNYSYATAMYDILINPFMNIFSEAVDNIQIQINKSMTNSKLFKQKNIDTQKKQTKINQKYIMPLILKLYCSIKTKKVEIKINTYLLSFDSFTIFVLIILQIKRFLPQMMLKIRQIINQCFNQLNDQMYIILNQRQQLYNKLNSFTNKNLFFKTEMHSVMQQYDLKISRNPFKLMKDQQDSLNYNKNFSKVINSKKQRIFIASSPILKRFYSIETVQSKNNIKLKQIQRKTKFFDKDGEKKSKFQVSNPINFAENSKNNSKMQSTNKIIEKNYLKPHLIQKMLRSKDNRVKCEKNIASQKYLQEMQNNKIANWNKQDNKLKQSKCMKSSSCSKIIRKKTLQKVFTSLEKRVKRQIKINQEVEELYFDKQISNNNKQVLSSNRLSYTFGKV